LRKKRADYISWDDMFMAVAAVASLRSKDPSTQHGACVVDPKTRKILAVGYNGLPRGCSDDEFPWDRDDGDPLNDKNHYIAHAERNCIDNRQATLDGCIMYLYSPKGYYPCSEKGCAQGIIQNGIVEVVMAFANDHPTSIYDWRPTKRMFAAAGVKMRIIGAKESARTFRNLSVKFAEIARIADEFATTQEVKI
jgi:dCMP deaminase